MADLKGPAVDADAFRVEGHCCAIRLPVTAALADGIPFRLTPEARAQLLAQGMQLPPADTDAPPPPAEDAGATG